MTAEGGAWSREATPRQLGVLGVAAIALLVALSLVAYRADPGGGTTSEADVYYAFADDVADGAVPYRDVTIEYPPGALPVFLLPVRLLGGTDGAQWGEVAASPAAERYEAALAVVLALLLAATIAVTAASLRLLRATVGDAVLALGTVAAAPLLLGMLPLTRYDAWPVLLTSLGVLGALAARHGPAGAAIGVAATAKLYPLVLVPALAAGAWRDRIGGPVRPRSVAALAAGLAAGAALVVIPFLAVAPRETVEAVRLQLARGLQMESLGGSVLATLWKASLSLDARGLLPRPLPVGSCERCDGLVAAQLTGRLADAVGVVSLALVVAALVLVARRVRDKPSNPRVVAWGAATSVAALVVLGKVLSAQFLLWLLPLVPLVGGRRGRVATALLVAAAVMTNVWFPTLYRDYVNLLAPGPVAFLLVRNAVLVAMLAVLLWPERSRAPMSP